MNNLNVVVFKEEEDITNKREMGELELHGAMCYIYNLVKTFNEDHFGENFVTLDEVDSCTYYCNKTLEIAEGGYKIQDQDGNTLILDSVFMREGNYSDLWGYVYYPEDEDKDEDDIKLYVVRI